MIQGIKLYRAIAQMALLLINTTMVIAQTKQDTSTDEAALRQLVKQVEAGWNAHDGKAFAAPFAIDADYVVVNGMSIKGREAIEKGHTAIFSNIYKDSHNIGTIRDVRFLRPDVAIVHIEWNLEFQMGGEKKQTQAINTMVMTKEGQQWSIAAFHNTPIQNERR